MNDDRCLPHLRLLHHLPQSLTFLNSQTVLLAKKPNLSEYSSPENGCENHAGYPHIASTSELQRENSAVKEIQFLTELKKKVLNCERKRVHSNPVSPQHSH